MKKIARVLALGVATLAVSAGLTACMHAASPEKRIAWVKEKVQDELKLSPEQTALLDKILKQAEEQRKAHEAERAAHQKELMELLKRSDLTMDDLKAVEAKLVTRLDSLVETFGPSLLELNKSLTAEQRTKVLTFIEKHQNRMHR